MRSLGHLAARQLADYRAGRPGTWFAEPQAASLDLAEAYAIAHEVVALRIASGERLAGYKVGCTGARVRQQFGMDGPIRGHVFEPELHDSGTTLSAAAYDHLAIEGELAVRLDGAGRIARVFPVIELHNYVFRGARPTLPELVANNGLHAGVVRGANAVAWHGDPSLTAELRVEINGETRERGPAGGVPGGPAGSLAWLAEHLAQHGLALQPGQIVLTGTPLGLVPVRAGDRIRVVADGLGEVIAEVTP
jgi:2-keto-4-pentenoate hydratase